MLYIVTLYLFGFLFSILYSTDVGKVDYAVKINGGEKVALKIANDGNFKYLGFIGNLEDTYHFQKQRPVHFRQKRSLEDHVHNLRSHEAVMWVEEQVPLIRTKRHFNIETNTKNLKNVEQSIKRRKVKSMFNDPKWPDEWYIYDMRYLFDNNRSDMHIVPVWDMNITGRGVKVTIIDDGLEHTHPDLKENYDPRASYDFNDDDEDPMPNTAPGTQNEHGTRCASEVSMSANNHICGVGIAYNSKIGGIRMLDGPINDLIEAKALGFRNDYIDIYSASWGPADDGKTMEHPLILTSQTLVQGTQKGRNGKGSIYVWASGNGGMFEDSCSCDGYVSSIYVISVNSILPNNKFPKFAEKCASTMCATYSSSIHQKFRLVAADVKGKCTNEHSGTSASAPYAAGIFALVLEMNPNITWRDMKHLVVWTSQYKPLKDVEGWKRNSAGFWVNSRFGFGVLDAYKMVSKAKSWVTVPRMLNCDQKLNKSYPISNNKSAVVVFDGGICSSKIMVIEHVLVTVNIKYPDRGVLVITLMSPRGMNTTLLYSRPYDKSNNGLINWPFNSVHNWGESPKGNWTILIEDKGTNGETRDGSVINLMLQFYGTKELPYHVKHSFGGQRDYD